MKQDLHPIEKIHHINVAFNRRFSGALYYCGAIITFLLIIFPYFLRTALAFFINIFFNRPRVYIDFARIIGGRLNIIPIFILYFIAVGVYAIFFQLASVLRQKKHETRWVSSQLKITSESYKYQS